MTPQLVLETLDTIQDVYIPGPLTDPQAIQLEALGLESKAHARNRCRQLWTNYQCPSGHRWRLPITCKQRFCPDCGKKLAETLREQNVHIYRMDDHRDFLYLHVHMDGVAMTNDNVKFLNELVGKVTRRVLLAIDPAINPTTKSQIQINPHTKVGIIDRTVPHLNSDGEVTGLVCKVLWYGTIRALHLFNEFFSRISEVRIEMWAKCQAHFRECLNEIFDAVIPSDPLARAECEAAFHKTRQLRTLGAFYDSKTSEPEKDTTATTTTTVEAPEQPTDTYFLRDEPIGDKSHQAPPPKCPCCGKIASHQTLPGRHWPNLQAIPDHLFLPSTA